MQAPDHPAGGAGYLRPFITKKNGNTIRPEVPFRGGSPPENEKKSSRICL